MAAFLYAHRQYGQPKAAVKPPDKTQQDVKDYGPVSPTDKTHQDALQNNDESARKELERVLEETIHAADAENIDGRDIDFLIEKLSTAFSRKSISELREIWPQMGSEKELIEREFDSAQTIRRTFHVKSRRFSSNRMTAEVSGSYEGKIITMDGKEIPSSGKFTLKLSKRDGNWYIDKAIF
jgi:hypothetical protein